MYTGHERVVSQEVSGPRRAVWDQADMQVRVSAYDGDSNVGDDEGKSLTGFKAAQISFGVSTGGRPRRFARFGFGHTRIYAYAPTRALSALPVKPNLNLKRARHWWHLAWARSSCISVSRESLLYTPVHADSRRTNSSCGLSAEALVHFL